MEIGGRGEKGKVKRLAGWAEEASVVEEKEVENEGKGEVGRRWGDLKGGMGS